MLGDELIWRVERTCLNGFPALKQVWLEDWLLRFAGGVSRRANCATPLAFTTRDVDRTIAQTEARFADQDRRPFFRVPFFIDQAIDRRLDQLGYGIEGETITLYGELEHTKAEVEQRVALWGAPAREWRVAMATHQGQSDTESDTYRQIVEALAIPAAFVGYRAEDGLAAVGYGAIHDGMLCFESIVTGAEHRGRGYGRRMLQTLLSWAKAQHAVDVCLQVQADNAPAIALYRSLGIGQELYRYHYRRPSR
jgi:ribosomal protein S18 acetylase RimI-like enzyme